MAARKCAIIDYGMGNLYSVRGALAAVAKDTEIIISNQPEQILAADHVVLPGVGAMRDCMSEILALGLDQVVREVARSKPLLGVCVGQQAMLEHSEENGGVDCLGLFKGQVKFFGDSLRDAQGQVLKVPHMGWNTVEQIAHPLWSGIANHSRFYFVHSYYVQAQQRSQVYGTGQYGVEFDAALGHENIFAVQFHPEKSHAAGLQLLHNFLAWDGAA